MSASPVLPPPAIWCLALWLHGMDRDTNVRAATEIAQRYLSHPTGKQRLLMRTVREFLLMHSVSKH